MEPDHPLSGEVRELYPGIYGCLVDWTAIPPDLDGLSDRERESLAGLKDTAVWSRRVVGCHVLRRLTAAVSGMSAETLRQAGEPGRIFWSAAARAWYGSVAHSGTLLLAAVSAHVIPGVDMELIRPRQHYLQLAERCFTAEESAWVQGAAELHSTDGDSGLIRFLKLWTRREAVVKALGLGVIQGFPRVAVPARQSLVEPVRIMCSGADPAAGQAWVKDIRNTPTSVIAALAWRPRDGAGVIPRRPEPE